MSDSFSKTLSYLTSSISFFEKLMMVLGSDWISDEASILTRAVLNSFRAIFMLSLIAVMGILTMLNQMPSPIESKQLNGRIFFGSGMAPRTSLESLPSNKDSFAIRQVQRGWLASTSGVPLRTRVVAKIILEKRMCPVSLLKQDRMAAVTDCVLKF